MPRNAPEAADSSWPTLLRAHALLLDRIEARLAEAGLPELAWYDVLWALERAPDTRLRMSDLSTEMVISRSNVTRLVDRMESAGLVARDRSCPDRRGAFAVLAAAGRKMRARIWPVYSTAISELYEAQLTPDENGVIRAALQRVIGSLKARQDVAGDRE